MDQDFLTELQKNLDDLKERGLYKAERIIVSPQGGEVRVADGSDVLNFCANNYLGLSNHPRLVEAGKRALDRYGFGMSSVRFICGTQDVHKELESRLSRFLGTEDTILYAACFDANGGLFESVPRQGGRVISDALNHASIIDGVRLCKAQRFRYANNDMADLEAKLRGSAGRQRPGGSSSSAPTPSSRMDGIIVARPEVHLRSGRRSSMRDRRLMDDCHGVGFMGDKRPRDARALRTSSGESISSPAPSARPSGAPLAATPRAAGR
jgi:glycine C-acetyltransferase